MCRGNMPTPKFEGISCVAFITGKLQLSITSCAGAQKRNFPGGGRSASFGGRGPIIFFQLWPLINCSEKETIRKPKTYLVEYNHFHQPISYSSHSKLAYIYFLLKKYFIVLYIELAPDHFRMHYIYI